MTVSSRTGAKSVLRQAQRDWLEEVIRSTGLRASPLAKKLGISDSTLTRFLNDPDYGGTLHPMTVQAISEFSGIAGPGAIAPASPGLREDGVPFEISMARPDDPVFAAIGQRRGTHPWIVKSDALLQAGVRPGDVIIIDPTVQPRDGDVVCCQFEEGATARTVFRLYFKPFVMGASPDPADNRPELVNDTTRRIVGVMTDMIRRRAAA